jgi:two-component system, cell cycle response regulator
MHARMLVIDDNAVNLDLMLYLLRAHGHDAQGCSDPQAALEAAMDGSFDIILSDVLMPGVDGYELAKRLKTDPRTAGIPLIAVTALAMPADRERVMEAGFDGYIAKPIDPQAFVAQIEAHIERFKPRRHGRNLGRR